MELGGAAEGVAAAAVFATGASLGHDGGSGEGGGCAWTGDGRIRMGKKLRTVRKRRSWVPPSGFIFLVPAKGHVAFIETGGSKSLDPRGYRIIFQKKD
jgi:hypothetical protein